MTRERPSTRVVTLACVCVLAGGGAAVWGFLDAREAFFTAWIAGFYFWVGVPVGALALLLIHDLTGGDWERTARPALTAAAATMPLFVLLFVPVAAGLPAIYSWARPEEFGALANRWYLNPDFFLARAAAYFVVWMLFAALKALRPAPLPPSLAGIGVILLAIGVAYGSIDWLMSIEPHWVSTIYPMVAGASQFIAALSLVLLAVAIAGPPPGVADEEYRSDLANLATLLLAVLIFWAYASFCQFLIIWEENLSDEIGWYIERVSGNWQGVVWALFGGQFLIPFVGLITTPAKRSRAVVGAVSALLLVAGLVQTWWLALPPFADQGFTWLAPAVAGFMGGALWLAYLFAPRSRVAPALAEARHG